MSQQFAELDNEFGLLEETAAEAEIPYGAAAAVRRSWVSVLAGGHVSTVVWGKGPADVVFLHEAGRSARAWDEVALALSRPAVAIDLPGTAAPAGATIGLTSRESWPPPSPRPSSRRRRAPVWW